MSGRISHLQKTVAELKEGSKSYLKEDPFWHFLDEKEGHPTESVGSCEGEPTKENGYGNQPKCTSAKFD